MDRKIILMLVVVFCSYQYWVSRPISRPAGILVFQQPQQTALPEDIKSIKYKDVLLKRLADYHMQARVLSTQRYWLGQSASVMPVDVAFGWDQMSDSSTLEKLKISQADRFYFYTWDNAAAVDVAVISKNSANMHLIPATKDIEKKIKKLRVGNIVQLTGQLVRVDFKDGSEIKSSLTRDDTGAGACEVVYVTSLDIN